MKRVYEQAKLDDGARFFGERLWPREINERALQLDAKAKNRAARNPSCPGQSVRRSRKDPRSARRNGPLLTQSAGPRGRSMGPTG
jgi:uncharacterized protein YeaO (DUF488 family)